MLLSHTCKVALKSAAYIASSSQKSVNIKELAEHIDENPHTIAKVLQTLVKSGFLNSITGPAGGFFLTAKQLQYTLADIIDAVDGEKALNSCVLGLKKCSAARPCPVHNEFSKARKEICRVFAETKLVNISAALQDEKTFLS